MRLLVGCAKFTSRSVRAAPTRELLEAAAWPDTSSSVAHANDAVTRDFVAFAAAAPGAPQRRVAVGKWLVRRAIIPVAGVAELADARDLKSRGRKAVRVRSPPPAPIS
jgi:hypothetical protein